MCKLNVKRVCILQYVCAYLLKMGTSVIASWRFVLSTFVAVFVMHPVQVVDGVHRVELDLGEVFVTDPVELRGGVGGRRPRHVVASHGGSMG